MTIIKPIIIANWKINLSLKKQLALAVELKKQLAGVKGKDVVVCPSFVSLAAISGELKKSNIFLGAQDVFWEKTGAYTGEVSPDILRELNCKYVIVGHSERRQYVGETDEMVKKKVETCLGNDLTPIICVGETRAERVEGQTNNVIWHQMNKALENISLIEAEHVIIAYEPRWAIGTGKTVEVEDMEDVFKVIRQTLIDLYPLTIVNNNVRLIYGGSVDASNAKEIVNSELISGLLIGTASLDAKEFAQIVKLI
ncbi:MAG TPA: triose-phosphate isomerase [Patescibacteria group bacterium]|nr:triose-phosphate isomerase [Patescibacteria group bacterium]